MSKKLNIIDVADPIKEHILVFDAISTLNTHIKDWSLKYRESIGYFGYKFNEI